MLVSMKVVICFHFTIFVVLETTPIPCSTTSWTLWFAFILLSLSYWKQPPDINPRTTLGSYYIGLWFAFILLSLSYWKQRQTDTLYQPAGCDLLSFYYLCRTGNNNQSNPLQNFFVVICFHFTIFVVLETTRTSLHRCQQLLWFAFILLSLSYWKQLPVICMPLTSCCDLLSFYYLCRTGNNLLCDEDGNCVVVICFHFTIFVVLETTGVCATALGTALWFAFILLSLSYWKQPFHIQITMGISCDLLSFYYLCRTGNNVRLPISKPKLVVICFHFTIFVVLETTIQADEPSVILLWFAFILLSLSYWKQRKNAPYRQWAVVICFHFTIFVVLETTLNVSDVTRSTLWFAFILLSLSYWKQHSAIWTGVSQRCDLLSFYYLCRTGNNQ